MCSVRILSVLAVLAATGVAFGQSADEPSAFVTAIAPQGQLLIFEEPARAGRAEYLVEGDYIDYRWAGPAEGRQATLFVPAFGATVMFAGVDVLLELTEDGGLRVTVEPGDATAGSVDLLRDMAAPPAEIVLADSTVTIGRGAVRATLAGADTWHVVVGQGQATVAGAGESRVIEAAGENRIDVGPDGPRSPTTSGTGVAEMVAEQSALTRAALLPDLVRVAESVAEGDIEPPTRGSRVAAAAVAPAVRIKEIVPRGGLLTRVENRAVNGIVGGAGQTLAEAFIGSGEAALAVVGARLQRTRVVGVSGIGGSALSINRELTLPFTLAPLRR